MRVRIIGAGSLGRALAQEAAKHDCEVEVADTIPERAERLAKEVGGEEVDTGASLDEVDLLVEAANQSAVASHVIAALGAGVDCMVLSTGAFTKPGVLERTRRALTRSGATCYLPSGGIAGIDAVKAIASEPAARVVLTTTKPPGSLGLKEDEAGEVFAGSATEAVRRYPKNVNVAATLELAGLMPEVHVVSDPKATRIMHEVFVRSERVEARITVVSEPSAANPATSEMALLSARALLRHILDPLRVGT